MKKMSSYNKTANPTPDLPFGNFKNESTTGANDGTELLAEQMQDLYYSLYQILQFAGVTPNGILEDGNQNKQFISALANISIFPYNSAIKYNKYVVCYLVSDGIFKLYMSKIDQNTALPTDAECWIEVNFDGDIEYVKISDIPVVIDVSDISDDIEIEVL